MKRNQHKLKKCSNCDFNFTEADNYCPVCGQKNHELKIPLKHLIEEFIESTLHLDTKIFVTLKYLLFSPGKLSKEYNEGRRVKFIAPVRLYIIISFLFFFLLNIYTPKNTHSEQNSNAKKNSAAINLTISDIRTNDLMGLSEAQRDSLIRVKGIEKSTFNKYLVLQLYKIANGGMGEFVHSFIKNISYMMFVLMPSFALLLFFSFKRQTNYFIESLIVSVHFHCFIFLFMSFFVLITLVKTIFFIFLTPLIVSLYLFFMLRNYYGRKIFTTLWKTAAIILLDLGLFIVMFILTMLLSVAII